MPTNAAKNLHGKTVLITGASSGIGRSCAFEFSRTSPASIKLILAARRVDRLHDISGEIISELGNGVQIHVVKLDVSKPDEVSRFWADIPEDFRDVDVLVNNAGFMSGYERAPQIPNQVIEDVWATNVTGLIQMTQAFLKIAKKRTEEALRKELIDTRIRVITVDPGQVLTEFTVIRNRGDEASADKVYE
ncbi:hypothetical protein N0V87_008449 [Didymella glomerata]|uniref:Uncharacterized protein n=1 Tax=Didymella glomerata TaxID=749621 RepID=A0A9W9BWW3_9PLEO|nr:hypothetical protein N0V87_008449 [Didymella glomerata]